LSGSNNAHDKSSYRRKKLGGHKIGKKKKKEIHTKLNCLKFIAQATAEPRGQRAYNVRIQNAAKATE